MADFVSTALAKNTTPAVAPKPVAPAHDPIYENAVNTINKNLAGLGYSRDTSLRRTDEDYTKGVDTAKSQNESNINTLVNRMANQGGSYSGVHVTEQGKVAKALQDTMGELSLGKARNIEDIQSDYAVKSAEQQSMLGQAEVERSGRETERQKEIAFNEAQAVATKTAGDAQRQWMDELTTRLTALAQPQPGPTGQLQPPPPAQAIVQQAIAAVPPPQIPVAPPNMIRNLQDELRHQGLDPGPTDGAVGPRTLTAYNKWRSYLGLAPVGRITMDDVNLLSSTVGIDPSLAGMNMGGTYKTMSGQQA
jgi:hypothetical protein